MKYHPDRPGGDKDKFAQIANARELLEQNIGKHKPGSTNNMVTWSWMGTTYTTTEAEYLRTKESIDAIMKEHRRKMEDLNRETDDIHDRFYGRYGGKKNYKDFVEKMTASNVRTYNVAFTLMYISITWVFSYLPILQHQSFYGSISRILYYMFAYSMWKRVIPAIGRGLFGKKEYEKHTWWLLKK